MPSFSPGGVRKEAREGGGGRKDGRKQAGEREKGREWGEEEGGKEGRRQEGKDLTNHSHAMLPFQPVQVHMSRPACPAWCAGAILLKN